jgi:DNA helicase-2/ATP-dependent DNA helicase PcrA
LIRTPADFWANLNPQQRAAAEHGSGPLLVIAGAGTGKTKTLAARVAALIRTGVPPGKILLLTFTRRAAQEMIRRAGQVVGETVAAGVWGGTFHAIAHRLLRLHGQLLGIGTRFTIMDQGDAQDLLHLIRTDLELHRSHQRFPQKTTLLAIYSRCVNTGRPLEEVLGTHFPWCQASLPAIKRIFQEYSDRKIRRDLLDYDDLLLYWDQALETGAADALAGRFEHLLVDEYQDTNPIQSSILRKTWERMTRQPVQQSDGSMSPPSACSIMVVGDDAQSIYSFRGATVENILRFTEHFSKAATVTLEQNYRSVTPILEAANAVMAGSKQGFTKNLWSQRAASRKPMIATCANEIEQSNFVVDRILQLREEGIPLTRQAVLFRATHNSDALEVELSRRNVPFVKWGGLRFLEAAHIKDLLAFLRLLENPRDELSWMRVLQLIEGIGPGRARQAVHELQQSESAFDVLARWKVPAAAQAHTQKLAILLRELVTSEPEIPVAAQIERIRQFYAPLFEQRYDQPEMRVRDLDQLELLAQQAPSRAVFVADLTLDPPLSTGDLAGPPLLDEEYVVLSTIHSAKGCEWDVVFVIHAADGVIPSDMSTSDLELEEERRLLYVAMTRARDQLYITFPLRYYHRKHALGDSHSFAQLTRFLPPALLAHFDRCGVAVAEDSASISPLPGPPVAESVQSRLRRLWD